MSVGKHNQPILPAPLSPIPVTSTPWVKYIIDVCEPLPKTKKGNQYLLTIMDTCLRYPEAIPLHNITTKAIIPVLKVFTTYGTPEVVQSDQGSNFPSKLFKEAMKALYILTCLSVAFHRRAHKQMKTNLDVKAVKREFNVLLL